jgi:hypothetical protein
MNEQRETICRLKFVRPRELPSFERLGWIFICCFGPFLLVEWRGNAEPVLPCGYIVRALRRNSVVQVNG